MGNTAIITVLNNADNPARIEIPLPINASSAMSLLDYEATEEPEKEEEPEVTVTEEEKAEAEEYYTMNVMQSAAAAFDAAELAELMKRVNRGIEDGNDVSDILKRAVIKLQSLNEDMKAVEAKNITSQGETTVANDTGITVSGGTAFCIDNGRLIVELGPNDGEVIYVK